MRYTFVRTSNVDRFLSSIGAVEDRGASEACFLLVGGQAGYGKSRTGAWWAIQNNAVLIRVKAAATPHWVMSDLVKELGEQAPARTVEDLFGQALGSLAKNRRPIVLDEVEHALHDLRAFEIIRDISDLVEVPIVLIGREFVAGRLKRHRQIWTRISAIADFQPATMDDVAKCCRELCEVPVADEVIALIHEQSEGHIREIIKAIKNVERIGRRASGKPVSREHVAGLTLTQDLQAVRRRVG